jgi:lipid A 4'-phosphatase
VKQTVLYLSVCALCVALFLLVPQLDLVTSGLFYAPGRGFFLRNWPPVGLLYRSVPWLAWGIAFVVGFGVTWLYLVERPLWRLDRRTLCFIVLSTALGPGLIVNSVLKDHWGRARPSQIEAFGGTRQFTPAPLPAAQCRRNCSFPSGHAALGFSLVAFAFLLPAGAARRRGVTAAFGCGAVVGLARVAQGAHFLSDVVFAGLIVYGMAATLHWWIVERDGLATPALRRCCGAAGRSVAAVRPIMFRAWRSHRLGVGTAAVALLVTVSVEAWDRPLALFFHAQSSSIHALFALAARLGLADGWLILFAGGFAALHWGGALPRLRSRQGRLRAWSPIPAFLFAAVAASGIATDIMKVVFGRTRPKLLFAANLYGFTWFGWHADLWSFPSGHSATIASLLAALWYLWPRHILFYVLVGAVIALSRVVVGAHFLGDAMAGAWLAVLTTRGVALLFARGGIDLAAARRGQPPPAGIAPWVCRCLGRLAPARERPDREPSPQLLAPAQQAIVSARDHGSADRHL